MAANLNEKHDLLFEKAEVCVTLEKALAVLSGCGARHDVPANWVPVMAYTAN